jgi:hypothetical protein
MFAVMGLSPVSSTVAGALIQVSATGVLIGAGVLMAMVVAIGALSPSVWRLGDESEKDGEADGPALTPAGVLEQAA